MAGYFQVSETANGQFTFNLKAGNHQVILTSRVYDTAGAVRDAIAQVRQHAATAAGYERKVAKDRSPYFVLSAPDGQVLGRSETYSSQAAMENGIQSVMANGASSVVRGLG